jgi:flagellar protein FliL
MAADEKNEGASHAGLASAGESSKLQLILIITNVVATLAMGVGLFISFQREKHEPSVNDIVTQSGEQKESKEIKNPEFGKMITLDQFTVNLSTPGSVNPKFARVNIAVEVPTDDTENELNQKMPQVRNTVIDLFNSKRPADLATPEGRDYLKDEIKKALNDFLVTGKVKGVFFTNFALSS